MLPVFGLRDATIGPPTVGPGTPCASALPTTGHAPRPPSRRSPSDRPLAARRGPGRGLPVGAGAPRHIRDVHAIPESWQWVPSSRMGSFRRATRVPIPWHGVVVRDRPSKWQVGSFFLGCEGTETIRVGSVRRRCAPGAPWRRESHSFRDQELRQSSVRRSVFPFLRDRLRCASPSRVESDTTRSRHSRPTEGDPSDPRPVSIRKGMKDAGRFVPAGFDRIAMQSWGHFLGERMRT